MTHCRLDGTIVPRCHDPAASRPVDNGTPDPIEPRHHIPSLSCDGSLRPDSTRSRPKPLCPPGSTIHRRRKGKAETESGRAAQHIQAPPPRASATDRRTDEGIFYPSPTARQKISAACASDCLHSVVYHAYIRTDPPIPDFNLFVQQQQPWAVATHFASPRVPPLPNTVAHRQSHTLRN